MANGSVKLNGKGTGNANATVAKVDAKHFFETVIPKLRSDKSKGVHVVYGALNETIGRYYEWYAVGQDGKEMAESKAATRAFMDAAVKAGIIVTMPCKGGAMAYLTADAPKSQGAKKAVTDAIAALNS